MVIMLGNILLEVKLANHLNDGMIVFEARKQCLYWPLQKLRED